MKNKLAGVIISFATFLIGLIVISYISQPVCADNVYWEKSSPDNKYTVTAYSRDCGATTNYNTQLSIRSGGKFDTKKDLRIFVSNGQNQAQADWLDSQHLLISYKDENIFQQEKNWRDINISYKEIK